MNIESIIGIISGVIAIVGAGRSIYKWLKKQPLTELMNELVDKNLTKKEHQKILREIDKRLLPLGRRIKNGYIQNFVLNDRGKEAVFLDLCLQNDWEPSKDLCEMFMKGNYPSIRKKYWEMKNSQQKREELTADVVEKVESISALTKVKSVIYLSELLQERFPDCFNRLTSILRKHDVEYRLLKGTKDIWCRDYMPIQTESGKFIQFTYNPSYLKGKKEWEDSRSDVREVCKLNNIEAYFSDINIDGGNVLICDGRAILSDRIFSENPDYEKEVLISELSKLLECEIIIIPAQNNDYTGHADGMVRFVDRNTILGNNLATEYKYWREGMQKVITQYSLKYIDVPFFKHNDNKHPESAIGIYVNYLEVNNLIVIPVFGRDEDKLAIDIIKNAFPDKVIETINYNDVAQEGGLLNCTTWVVNNK